MRQISQNELEEYLSYICYPQYTAYFVVVYCKINTSIFVTVANTLGSGCEYDEQCSYNLGEAVCTNKQCKCAEGTSLRNDNTCGMFHI